MEKKVKIASVYEENICPICGSELVYSAEDPYKHAVPWHCDCCKATGDLEYHAEDAGKIYGPNLNVRLKDGTPVELVDPNSPEAGPLTISVDCEEGVCPVCGGSLTYNGCKEDDDNGCTYPWVCDNCVPASPAPVKAAGGWFVPVTWEMHGVVRIPFEKAATLAEAIKLIKEDPDIELPKGHYVDDSFAPSFEEAQIEEVRALYNDNRPDGEVTV